MDNPHDRPDENPQPVQRTKEYRRKVALGHHTAEQGRAELTAQLLARTERTGHNAFTELSDWFLHNTPGLEASWQERARHYLATLMSVELALAVDERIEAGELSP